MASSLAQQLQKVSTALGHSAGQTSYASLLYSEKEAADTDTETVQSNAAHGLEQLGRADARFYAFERSLFGPASLTLDIGKLTQSDLAALDKSISDFLLLLSNHFLSPGAFKTLEYLVRKYRLHQRRAPELIKCGLPFHSTNQFVRLVQTCRLEKSVWQFLKPMQQSGAPLPRTSLMHRCKSDKALLQAICDIAKESATSESLNRPKIALYAVLICEILGTSAQVDEDLMRLLLPYLLYGVESDPQEGKLSSDYRAATFMILVQLSTVATLAPDLVEVLLVQILKHSGSMDPKYVLMVASQLVATQPKLTTLSAGALKALCKLDGVGELLGHLQIKKAKVAPFLALLSTAACQDLEKNLHLKLLLDLARNVDLGDATALLTEAVLKKIAAVETPTETCTLILRQLDAKYPQTVANSLKTVLEQAESDERVTTGERVTAALSGSARAPISGSSECVAQAIDSANPELRIQAVAQLDALVDNTSEAAFVEAAITRRLNDDEPSVVSAVLSSQAVKALNTEALVTNLTNTLKLAKSKVDTEAGSKASRKLWREVCKKALKLLVVHSTDKDQAASEVLSLGLSSEKLFAIAVKIASTVDHPLLQGLVSEAPASPAKKPPKSSGKSPKNAGKEESRNPSQIDSLKSLSKAIVSVPPETVLAVYKQGNIAAQVVLLLGLQMAFTAGAEAAGKAVLLLCEEDWQCLDGDTSKSLLNKSDSFDEQGAVSSAYIGKSTKDLVVDRAWLLRKLLLTSIQSLSETGSSEDSEGLVSNLLTRTPMSAFEEHLQASLSLCQDPESLLAAIFASPPPVTSADKQVAALRLFQNACQNTNKKISENSLPSLLVAMSHPAAAVREAALEAAEVFSQSKRMKAGHKHEHEFLAALLSQKQKIAENETSLVKTAQNLLHVPPETSGKSKAATPSKKKHVLSKTAVQHLHKILLEAVGQEKATLKVPIAQLIIQLLRPSVSPSALLSHCLPLMRASLPSCKDEDCKEFVVSLLQLFTPVALDQPESKLQETVDFLLSIVSPPRLSSQEENQLVNAEVQSAAMNVITPELYALFSAPQQTETILALTEASSTALDSARFFAHQTLERLPISASVLQPTLQLFSDLAPKTPTPSKKRQKTSKTPKTQAPSTSTTTLTGIQYWAQLPRILELLQWKVVERMEDLGGPLSSVLQSLLTKQASHQDNEDLPENEDTVQNSWSSSTSYLIQLTLNALMQVLQNDKAAQAVKEVDVQAVAVCAAESQSLATQNAALRLLARLAECSPQKTMDITLQVVSSLGRTASGQENRMSHEVAESTIKAVTPAWVNSGKEVKDLVSAILDKPSGLTVDLCVSFLHALIVSIPQEPALEVILLQLVDRTVEAAKKGDTAAPGLSEEQLLHLAGLLCQKVPFADGLAALSGVLTRSFQHSGSKADSPHVVLTTALITTSIQASRHLINKDARLDSSVQSILKNALVQLQAVGSDSGGVSSKRSKQAAAGVKALIEELQTVLPVNRFIDAVLSLVQHSDDGIKRRALSLLADFLQQRSNTDSLEAAMKLCPQVLEILGGKDAAITKQAALVALGVLTTQHGKSRPQDILTVVPALLQLLHEESWLLRSSALACISAVVKSLGVGVLPQLPKMLPAVLTCCKEAVSRLSGSETPSEEEVEHIQLEGQACIAAMSALVENLGQFLSSHLPELLGVLLQPQVLVDPALQAPTAAVRAGLKDAVPLRLLLPALLAQLDSALQAGENSVEALSGLAALTVEGLEPQTASANSETLWSFVLNLLEVRQRENWDIKAIARVEAAAIQLLMKLVMKLNERQFKPLFMRLLSWASDPTLTGNQTADRQIIFFKVINALADGLRGVFVPYFRHLQSSMLSQLSSAQKTKANPKKKRKVSSVPAEGEKVAPIRLQVLLALHKRLRYGGDEPIEEEVFNSFLPHVVAQLEYLPSAEALEADKDDSDGANPTAAAEGLDVYGRAVIATTVQMAVSSGNDALWKPLHHQVLMKTREDDSRVRRRALQVLVDLVERIGEEYVVLLPEAMPFLAELLEDPELNIQNGTKLLLKQLETVSGESLDEYLRI